MFTVLGEFPALHVVLYWEECKDILMIKIYIVVSQTVGHDVQGGHGL
jgi:hypothetical protein